MPGLLQSVDTTAGKFISVLREDGNTELCQVVADETALQTEALTGADQTVTVAQRYIMLPGAAALACTVTITPPAAGSGFLFEIGLQTVNVVIKDGGPGTPILYTVVAGTRFAVWCKSDGTNVIEPVFMPLASDPA